MSQKGDELREWVRLEYVIDAISREEHYGGDGIL